MPADPRVLDRRHDHTRSAFFGRFVNLPGIVSRIADDGLHSEPSTLDHSDSGFGVIDVRAGERSGDDYPSTVDSQMQLLPALEASLAMFDGRPLAFTEHREAGAVDDQVDGSEM